MLTPTVLIKADACRIAAPAETMAEITGVSAGFPVAGRADRVAIDCAAGNREPADVISKRMRRPDGIVETETMIALRAYSRHALAAGFEPGLG